MQYASAREFFEAVSEASRDAERCRVQLESMEHRALSVSSPSLEAHVRGGDHDHVGRKVAALVDRERELQSRIDADYDLIDAACAVLYGSDGMSDGLASIVPAWWADAVYHRYLGLRSWVEVGRMLDYSDSHVRRAVSAAFDVMDANGMLSTVAGQGGAQG